MYGAIVIVYPPYSSTSEKVSVNARGEIQVETDKRGPDKEMETVKGIMLVGFESPECDNAEAPWNWDLFAKFGLSPEFSDQVSHGQQIHIIPSSGPNILAMLPMVRPDCQFKQSGRSN